MELEQLISFHESRLGEITKLVRDLNKFQSKHGSHTTNFIDSELQIQEGEFEVSVATLNFLYSVSDNKKRSSIDITSNLSDDRKESIEKAMEKAKQYNG